MPTSGFIYLWINKIDGKKYLGKCWGSPSGSYIGSGKHFRSAFNKYGKENFERIILEHCGSKEELSQREQHWLNYYDAANNDEFYNISPNAGGGHHGADYTKEKNPMWGKKHPNHKPHYGKENGMYGTHRSLAENPNAKSYFIIDDNDNEFYIKCLKEFVQSRFPDNASKVYQSLKEQALRGTFKKANKGHNKGWRIKHDSV